MASQKLTHGKGKLMNDDFQLHDVRNRSDLNPPSPAEIARLAKGDSVELETESHLFTVEIRERERDKFIGRVTESTPFLPAGAIISFYSTNIIRTFIYGKP
jgi:hypothetical protein